MTASGRPFAGTPDCPVRAPGTHRAADREGGGWPQPGAQGAGTGDGRTPACPARLGPGKDVTDALGLAICHAHAGASSAAIACSGTLAPKAHAQFRKGRSYW